MTTDKPFKIARITAAHGIRGEVKLLCFLEDPTTLARYNPFVTKQGKSISLTITGHVKELLIARIEGITDRNEAELLRGIELFTSSAKLPQKSESEYYHQELIGLSAVNDAGEKLGEVIAIHNFGAGDIIEIAMPGGELMLPFKAPFVGEIHMEKGTLHVTLPEYTGEEES
jgi:16S rRNA processing protein RimM